MPKGRSLPDHAVIIVLPEYNPGRINFGDCRRRFALYRQGMTVGEYRAIMAPHFSREQAGDALRYDQNRGYIYVDEDPPDERMLM